ncbi:hypothetical protein CFN78_15630 [Amycolatopsis antarctica]|uniref:Uncharacterized protein n=1 Tax=Amycolatopsis antarctica TaxID=1854586 RepID=A0A263D2E2_9PSEU|nr:hypothetical protein CFN78_15630 [Amycolatopsis antarctica]
MTAASGLTLQVLGGDTGSAPCEEATRVVRQFHERIAGRQAAGSDEPATGSVEGWDCVSGPPSAQGGTSCGKGTLTVLAAVVPAE